MRELGWRDDTGDEEADDRDESSVREPAADLRSRYGHPDPRANRWTWADIGVGWVAGLGALVLVGVAHGALAVAAGNDASAILLWPIAMTIPGGLVLAIFGIPVAVVLATLLRHVRSEAVHLVAFLGAGLLGAWLLSLVLGGVGTFVVLGPYAVAVAVTARIVAKRCAIRRRERGPRTVPADPG